MSEYVVGMLALAVLGTLLAVYVIKKVPRSHH